MDATSQTAGESGCEALAGALDARLAAAAPQPFSHRPEPPAAPDTPARGRLPGPAAGEADPVSRLLLGRGPAGAEARLVISLGPLAGTEIHLRQVSASGAVEAALLTNREASRQTLALAMDEVAERLRRKGRLLKSSFAGPRTAGAEAAAGVGCASRRDERNR